MYLNSNELHVETSNTGARISTLQLGSKHFFYPQQLIEKEVGVVKRGGMHICSPVFSSPGNKGVFSQAPQHGELRYFVWDSQISSVNKPAHNQINYSAHYKEWGADLLYSVSYLVKENRLSVCTGITNRGHESVAVELGWHPYFNAPNGGKIIFGDSESSSIEINSAYGPKIFQACETIKILLHGIGSVKMYLGDYFNDGFVCVWTDWRRKYFCVEPLFTYKDYSPGITINPKENLYALLSMSFFNE